MPLSEEALRRARPLGAPHPRAQAELGLGHVQLGHGDAPPTQPLFEEAVPGHHAKLGVTSRCQLRQALRGEA